jgi:CheY-like chemotaxis protein
MSHELRTPMNAVLGVAELLQETALTEEQQEYCTIIEGGSKALLTLLGDILDLSKLEAGKVTVEQVAVDLYVVAEQALSLVSPQAHEKGIELYFYPDPEAPSAAVTDPARLQQVLVNLLSNAVKYTDRGRVTLELIAEENQEKIWFLVKDTGIGIDPGKVKDLFQPFFQVGVQDQRKGTGLGLMISQALVALLGGEIVVESVPGAGSTFSFFFISHGQARGLSQHSVVTKIPGKILLVDVHDTSAKMQEELLHGVADEVLSVGSAADFFQALQALPPRDLIILDPRGHGEDPLGFLGRLLEHRHDLPPVLLLYPKSAPDRKEIEKFFQTNFTQPGDFILTKPIMPHHFLQAVLASLTRKEGAFRSRSRASITENIESDQLSVLVAEDNIVNQKVITLMLSKIGCRVEVVENGKLAIDALRRNKFDILFLDMQMPVLDGLETAREIRKTIPKENRPRIIGLTANALAGDREHCLAAGMDDYLTKPVQLDELIRAMGLARRESERIQIATTEIIDHHVAAQLRLRYSPTELATLLEDVSQDITLGCAAISDALREMNLPTIEVVSGRLKERCAAVGLVRIYTTLTKIEHDARNGNTKDLIRFVGRLEGDKTQSQKALLRFSSSRSG